MRRPWGWKANVVAGGLARAGSIASATISLWVRRRVRLTTLLADNLPQHDQRHRCKLLQNLMFNGRRTVVGDSGRLIVYQDLQVDFFIRLTERPLAQLLVRMQSLPRRSMTPALHRVLSGQKFPVLHKSSATLIQEPSHTASCVRSLLPDLKRAFRPASRFLNNFVAIERAHEL
jgi:hypothetical protein